MAYSAYQYSGGILYPEHASQIVIDSASDLENINLDTLAPGSRVVDCSTGTAYILSPAKEWSELPTGGGSGGPSGSYVTSVNGSSGVVTGIQTTANLVTSVSSSSTNSQYPSAKLFYDTVGNIEALLAAI